MYTTYLGERRGEASDVVLGPAGLVDAPYHVGCRAPFVAHFALGRRHALRG